MPRIRKKCEHSKEPYRCIDCHGASMCYHGKRRAECVECGGASVCEHGKRRAICRECNGRAICEHSCRRTQCKNCEGISLCDHGVRRATCKQCNGSALCQHDKQRSGCVDCAGTSICPHNKFRPRCGVCGGSQVCLAHPISQCGHIGNAKYDKYCTHCFGNMFPNDPRTAGIRSKSKEIKWVNALLQSQILAGHQWFWDKPFHVSFSGGCCNTKRRIDLWTIIGNVVVAIEIDEFQHKDRASGYEETRYNDLAMDFTGRSVFVRVNPDRFKLLGVKQNPSFEERFLIVEKKLAEVLDSIAEEQTESSALVQVHHLFYDD